MDITMAGEMITCFFFPLNVILINRKKNFKQKMEFIKRSESKAADLLKSYVVL